VSTLKDTLQADMKSALRAGDKARLTTVRMALAAIQRREVDEREQLDNTAVLQIIEKLVKQGAESAKQFESGGREDLAAKEKAEIEVLKTYLPEPLDDTQLDALIDEVIAITGATSIKDMGKVMNELRGKAQGRADMGAVSGRVKAKLAS
jgi:uncharacterized protein YqeY